MYPSAALCHAQEAVQLERAAKATLENVRLSAVMAANAWAAEALRAHEREQRHAEVRATAQLRTAAKRRQPIKEQAVAGVPTDGGSLG